MSRAMKEQHLQCNLRRGGQEWPPVERSVVPGGGRGGGGTTLGLDLHSPVRISDFVVAAPTVFADRWLGGETVTPRSPAIWRWRRIDQGEVVCHLPEVERSLWDRKTICGLAKIQKSWEQRLFCVVY